MPRNIPRKKVTITKNGKKIEFFAKKPTKKQCDKYFQMVLKEQLKKGKKRGQATAIAFAKTRSQNCKI